MSITCAKLAKLADYYGFDLDEAREYIGLPPSGKRGRPKVEKSKVEKSKVEKSKVEKSKVEKSKVEKPKTKQYISGYQLFLKEYQPILTAKHKAKLKPGEKLNITDILNGVTYEWNALSENRQKLWNQIS